MSSSIHAHILLLCADPLESKLLTLALEQAGLLVTAAANLEAAAQTPPVDLIILTNYSTGYLGMVQTVRTWSDAPLLLLTDYQREADHITALKEGVDLIFFRPYSIRFLAAQIPALLRRVQQPTPLQSDPDLTAGDIRLDPRNQTLQLGHEPPTRLSQLEFRLLYTLMRHPSQVITTEKLIEHVWGYSDNGDSKLVRKLVWRLRTKLKDSGRETSYIHTIPNVGYSFRNDPQQQPQPNRFGKRLRQSWDIF